MMDWLREGAPAIRWQVLRDLRNASADDVAAERARVEHDGWGARLLALEDPDGPGDGGACSPAPYAGGEPGQPWTATRDTLQTLQLLGLDPASQSARRVTGLVAENGRWEHAGQRYFDGEVEPCINGRTIETGAYFGVDVAAIVERILAERLADGGWNCEAENGSVRSSFDTTINVLDGLAEFERATGGAQQGPTAPPPGEGDLLARGPFRPPSTGAGVHPADPAVVVPPRGLPAAVVEQVQLAGQDLGLGHAGLRGQLGQQRAHPVAVGLGGLLDQVAGVRFRAGPGERAAAVVRLGEQLALPLEHGQQALARGVVALHRLRDALGDAGVAGLRAARGPPAPVARGGVP